MGSGIRDQNGLDLNAKLATMTTVSDVSVNRGVDTTAVFLGSSGLYSGQYNSTFTRRNRSSTSTPESLDECCLLCCCGLCTFGASLFCCGNLTRARRVQILWIWLTLLSLVGGILCSVWVFGQFSQNVAPTDMRIIDKKLSPYFCESVTVDSNTAMSVYMLNDKPSIDTDNLEHFEERLTSYVMYNTYKHWKFYLLQGSVITALSCADVTVEMSVIKGGENFNKWKNDPFCSDCLLADRVISFACDGSVLDNYTLTASESDDYFFVYSESVDDTWVSVDFRVKRTVYDTDGATSICADDLECNFDLDFHKHQVLVYQVSKDLSDIDLQVTSQCNARVWFYMIAFCACPLTLGCILSVVLYKCCKEPRGHRLDVRPPRRVLSRFPNERTPLLYGAPVAVPEPPKYDDVVRNGDTAPPTYEQATS